MPDAPPAPEPPDSGIDRQNVLSEMEKAAPPATSAEAREDQALRTIDQIEEKLTPESFLGPAPARAESLPAGVPAWYRLADRAGRPIAAFARSAGLLLVPLFFIAALAWRIPVRLFGYLRRSAEDPSTGFGWAWQRRGMISLIGNLAIGVLWLYVHLRIEETVPLMLAATFCGLGLLRFVGIAHRIRPPVIEEEAETGGRPARPPPPASPATA